MYVHISFPSSIHPRSHRIQPSSWSFRSPPLLPKVNRKETTCPSHARTHYPHTSSTSSTSSNAGSYSSSTSISSHFTRCAKTSKGVPQARGIAKVPFALALCWRRRPSLFLRIAGRRAAAWCPPMRHGKDVLWRDVQVWVGRVAIDCCPTRHFPPRCQSRSRFSGGQPTPTPFPPPPGRAARLVGAIGLPESLRTIACPWAFCRCRPLS